MSLLTINFGLMRGSSGILAAVGRRGPERVAILPDAARNLSRLLEGRSGTGADSLRHGEIFSRGAAAAAAWHSSPTIRSYAGMVQASHELLRLRSTLFEQAALHQDLGNEVVSAHGACISGIDHMLTTLYRATPEILARIRSDPDSMVRPDEVDVAAALPGNLRDLGEALRSVARNEQGFALGEMRQTVWLGDSQVAHGSGSATSAAVASDPTALRAMNDAMVAAVETLAERGALPELSGESTGLARTAQLLSILNIPSIEDTFAGYGARLLGASDEIAATLHPARLLIARFGDQSVAERTRILIEMMHSQDVAAVPLATKAFGDLLVRVAKAGPTSDDCQQFVAAVSHSGFAMAAPLIDRLLHVEEAAPQALAGEVLTRWGYDRHSVENFYVVTGTGVQVACILDREMQKRRVIVSTAAFDGDLKKTFEVVAAQLSLAQQRYSDVVESAVDIVVPQSSLPQDDAGAVAALETIVNDAVAAKVLDGGLDRLWRITFVVEQGPESAPRFYTFRNRDLYSKAKKGRVATYVHGLSGDSLFVEDPIIRGIHPVATRLFRLYRLKQFEVLAREETGNPDHLLLRIRQEQQGDVPEEEHYYLGSIATRRGRLYEQEPAVLDDLLPELETAYAEQMKILRDALNDKKRWPDPRRTPPSNRTHLHLRGALNVERGPLESWLADFAKRTMALRHQIDFDACDIELNVTGRGRYRGQTLSMLVRIVDETPYDARIDIGYVVKTAPITDTGVGTFGEYLVAREVLERMESDSSYVPESTRCKPVQGQIKPKTPLQRARQLAKDQGATTPHDKIDRLLRGAVERLWATTSTPMPGPMHMREIFVAADGSLQIENRPYGADRIKAAAFLLKIPLPYAPEGMEVVVYGPDPGQAKMAPMGLKEGQLARRVAVEVVQAHPTQRPFILLPDQSAGAEMVPPWAFIKHWNQDKDGRGYLTREGYAAVAAELKVDPKVEFAAGRWEEDRFYVEGILLGGTNSISLVGSGLSAGAMTALREMVPTAVLVAGINMGITSYNSVLVASPGLKPPGDSHFEKLLVMHTRSALGLTGVKTAGERLNTVVYADDVACSGPTRLIPAGIASHEVTDGPQSYDNLVAWLDRLAAEGVHRAPLSSIAAVEIPSTRLPVTQQAFDPPDDVEGLIDKAKRAAVTAGLVRSTRKDFDAPWQHPYDTRVLFEGVLDRGSIVWERVGESHHGITGTARLQGYPVAFWGVQGLPEVDYGSDGKKVGFPRKPGASLFPDSAQQIATFIEALRGRRLPIIANPAILGFAPFEVPGNLKWGSRIERAMQQHDAPILEILGPDQSLLGGGDVVVSPWISRWGHIEKYGDPRALFAVLDPTMWVIPNFGKRALQMMTDRVRAAGITGTEVDLVAKQWFYSCILALSNPRRAELDKTLTRVIPIGTFRELAASRVADWYEGRWAPIHG